MKTLRLGALLLCALIGAYAALAAEIRLFDGKGKQVANYDGLINSLSPGDELVFSGGKRFVFQGFLGEGHTTKVLKVISNGMVAALRVPIKYGDIILFDVIPVPASDFIDETIKGAPILERSRVPVPRLLDSEKGQFVLNEIVPHRIDGYKFLLLLDNPTALELQWGIDPAKSKLMQEALVEFASLTREFSQIGDFKPAQMVFNEETHKWVLLDWMAARTQRAPAKLPAGYRGVFGDTFGSKYFPQGQAREVVEKMRQAVMKAPLPKRGCLARFLELAKP